MFANFNFWNNLFSFCRTVIHVWLKRQEHGFWTYYHLQIKSHEPTNRSLVQIPMIKLFMGIWWRIPALGIWTPCELFHNQKSSPRSPLFIIEERRRYNICKGLWKDSLSTSSCCKKSVPATRQVRRPYWPLLKHPQSSFSFLIHS